MPDHVRDEVRQNTWNCTTDAWIQAIDPSLNLFTIAKAQTAVQVYRYATLILNYLRLEFGKFVAGQIFPSFLSTDPTFLITESSLLILHNMIVYFKTKLLKESDDDESVFCSMLDSILKKFVLRDGVFNPFWNQVYLSSVMLSVDWSMSYVNYHKFLSSGKAVGYFCSEAMLEINALLWTQEKKTGGYRKKSSGQDSFVIFGLSSCCILSGK